MYGSILLEGQYELRLGHIVYQKMDDKTKLQISVDATGRRNKT